MGLNDSYRERLSIFDLTVEEVAEDYGLPLEYVIDVLISNGVEEPVYPNDVLSSRVKGKLPRYTYFLVYFVSRH